MIRCKQRSEYSNFTTGFMVGLNRHVSRRMKKKEASINLFVIVVDFMLRQHTGKFIIAAGKVFEPQTNPMEAFDTFGDGCGSNYANSQSSNQNMPLKDATRRVSAVQESARSPR